MNRQTPCADCGHEMCVHDDRHPHACNICKRCKGWTPPKNWQEFHYVAISDQRGITVRCAKCNGTICRQNFDTMEQAEPHVLGDAINAHPCFEQRKGQK